MEYLLLAVVFASGFALGRIYHPWHLRRTMRREKARDPEGYERAKRAARRIMDEEGP